MSTEADVTQRSYALRIVWGLRSMHSGAIGSASEAIHNYMEALVEKLKSLVGADAVVGGAYAGVDLGPCTTGVRRSIAAVVFPSDSSQVTQIVKLAGEQGVPIYPVSTGRNWGYGINPVIDGCIVLNLSRLKHIIEPIDRITGLITVEPGVTQGDLAEFLERERLPFLVPTTGAGPSASIIGNALERGHGITPISDHFAAVIGIEAVLPDGTIYRSPCVAMGALSGGHAYKWGIGPYVDGLFAQGGFGVVTKMTLALARRPESIKAFVCSIAPESTLEEAISAVQNVVRSLPGVVGGINVMNAHRVLSMAAPYPTDRLGPDGLIPEALLAELTARYRVAPWTVFGTLYGTKRVVAAAQKEVRSYLAPLASRLTFVSPETAALLKRIVRTVPIVRERLGRTAATLSASMTLVSGRPNQTALPVCYWKSGRPVDLEVPLDPARDGCGLIWYAPLVEMKPTTVRRFVDMIVDVMPRHGFEPLLTLISLSERCFVTAVPVLFNLKSVDETAAAQQCHSALLDAGAKQGFFPYRVGGQSMDWLMSTAPDHWRLVSRLKQAIDPKGIIAPGRYAPVAPSQSERTSFAEGSSL